MTENMCAKVEELNNKLNKDNFNDVVIGSMDAKNLYPSLQKDQVADICQVMIAESPLQFSRVKSKEIVSPS